MAKSEWGSKRKCLKCGTFFYDMGKNNFSCPKCKESYSPDSYEETKTKQLLKMAKETEASAADEESLDEETLLKMTEDVPLSEDDLGPDELEILEDDPELNEQNDSDFGSIVQYSNEESGEH